IIGTAEGEKIKPLRGLEESMKAGKALLRSSAPTEPGPVALDLGLGQSNVVQFPDPAESQPTAPPPSVAPPTPAARAGEGAGAPPSAPGPSRVPSTAPGFSALPEEEPDEPDAPDFSDRDDTLRGGRFRVAG